MNSAIELHSFSDYKKELAAKILSKGELIRDWYSTHAQEALPPLYCSVDLRDSGHKIVPVDSNLFPAGFNNICAEDLRTAPPHFRRAILDRVHPDHRNNLRKVLILPEFHTQNRFYLENLYFLRTLVEMAGFEVHIAWIQGESPTSFPLRLKTESEKEVIAYELKTRENRAFIETEKGEFIPDVILLNNDFSGGYPPLLDSIEQPILPSHQLGWHSRKKSEHFKHYNRLAKEFAELIGIDPWVFQIETEAVEGVNFNDGVGLDRVAETVERVLNQTQSAYTKRGITQKPFTFVKNNAGTYGIGIMVVHSSDEIRTMNRRTKNKMSVGKNKRSIDSIVVQEGIPTATLVDRLAAEPVIYLFGCELVGGFLRTNTERGIEENLNSQGMVFRKLCMSDLHGDQDDQPPSIDETYLEVVYGSVARLSALATGLELKERLGHNA